MTLGKAVESLEKPSAAAAAGKVLALPLKKLLT
jgi:hypothetical protein